MQDTFPNKTIYPIFGNHESNPVNYYDINDTKNETISNMRPIFEQFLTKQQYDDYINKGIYSKYINNSAKIIGMNCLLFIRENPFMTFMNTDVNGILENLI